MILLKWCVIALAWVLVSNVQADEFNTGIVKPLRSLELSMAVDGVVTARPVAEGEAVAAGGVILQLDEQLQALEVQRKKALWKDRSSLKTLSANLEEMEQLLLRKEALAAASRAVSQADLNRVRIQMNSAQGEYDMARQNEVREKLDYQIAEEVLSYYHLNSPIAGELVEVVPDVGEWVKAGDVVARVVDHSQCILALDVDVATALQLVEGETVAIRVHMPNQDVDTEGVVEFVSPVADEGSTLVKARIRFDNQSGEVVPGVTASLVLDQEGGN